MSEESKHPILVVDDEPEILFSLKGLLRREFLVQTAGSGSEAMEILAQQPVHVIMTDQRMPVMTGVELLTQVQGAWPDAIRMVFTGYSDIKAVIDAINQGHIFRYILKPWDPDELRAILHQACDEYDRIVAQRQLLTDLRGYQGECGTLLEALAAGMSKAGRGKLDGDALSEIQRLMDTGAGLRERLDRALA
jgi:DNA-binding NtrC family response regulator